MTARRAASIADIGRREPWHRTSSRSGTLRAVIFGVSDGLVSNLSLVMGVAGASAAQPRFVVLAGVAGLLAGAFSMAAGEYISMQSQRELFERQIELERAEMEAMPEEEEAELAAAYRAKGFARDEATRIAHRLFQDPEAALDMLVREELGLDPDELGSPWGAAIGSMISFAIGAAVPVIPFLFGGGFTIDDHQPGPEPRRRCSRWAPGVSLLTGRGMLFSGLRQLGIGLGAAVVTYLDRLDHRRRRGSLMRWARRRSCASGWWGRGWTPGRGRTAPATSTAPTTTAYDKVIVVTSGSITFGLDEGAEELRRWRPPGAAGRHRPRRERRPGWRGVPGGAPARRHAGRRRASGGRNVVTRPVRNRPAVRRRIR